MRQQQGFIRRNIELLTTLPSLVRGPLPLVGVVLLLCSLRVQGADSNYRTGPPSPWVKTLPAVPVNVNKAQPGQPTEYLLVDRQVKVQHHHSSHYFHIVEQLNSPSAVEAESQIN